MDHKQRYHEKGKEATLLKDGLAGTEALEQQKECVGVEIEAETGALRELESMNIELEKLRAAREAVRRTLMRVSMPSRSLGP
eukprot:14196504-Alexandrium_andersonii.AAC.1